MQLVVLTAIAFVAVVLLKTIMDDVHQIRDELASISDTVSHIRSKIPADPHKRAKIERSIRGQLRMLRANHPHIFDGVKEANLDEVIRENPSSIASRIITPYRIEQIKQSKASNGNIAKIEMPEYLRGIAQSLHELRELEA